MKSSTQTLTAALRVLSREIYCEDGAATAAIAEAADRLEEMRTTDAERAAIQRLIEDYEGDGEPASHQVVSTLRGLLERLK